MRHARRDLKRFDLPVLKRREERRARNDTKRMTPRSPLGKKTTRTKSVPVPAPNRSEKYILFTRLEALEIANDIVRPAKKKGMLRRK